MMGTTRLLTTLAAGAAAIAVAANTVALAGDHKQAEVGQPAPNFTLTDANGKEWTLADYKDKIVVLEWTNPDCPIVMKCYQSGAMQNAYKKVKKLDKDVVWVAINTTHYTSPEQNIMWGKTQKLEYPILLDTDGAVGHTYDARRTPHMFVIDKEGTLRYHGAIDNNSRGDKSGEGLNNYVVTAVEQIVVGETVAPDYVKPYGCSVKYAKK